MSRFLYIFALGTFLSISYISGVGSAPASKSIINEIEDDKNICPTPTFLYNSSYTSECTKIQYPSKPLNFSINNLNTFLCLGLYDISYRICYLESRNFSFTQNLPHKENELDLQLKQLKWTNDSIKFCKQLQSFKYSPMYSKIQLEVTMLSSEIMNLHKCGMICFDLNVKLNPLCSIWVWASKLLMSNISSTDKQSDTQHISPVSLTLNESKTSKNNFTLQKVSLAKETSPTSQSKVMKTNISKPSERLPSGKENASPSIKNDHELKTPLKDNNKTQISNIALSNVIKQNQDSKTETKTLVVDKTQENLHMKSESSIPSTNKESQEPENSIGSPADVKNMDQSQQLENTGGSISQAAIPPQNADDQREFNSEDFNADPYDTGDSPDLLQDTSNSGHSLPKASEIKDTHPRYPSIRTEDDSHFFAYFVVITLLCVAGYVGYHNKQKILAIVLEGRRSRGGRGRRRPNTASYRKLDCTLEEAVTSQCNSNVTHVIY